MPMLESSRQPMRLWHYLTLIVNAIILAAFIGYGTYMAHEQNSIQAKAIKRDTLNLGQSIAAGSANDILTASFDRIENRLLRQVAISTVQELLIADAKGIVIARVNRLPSGEAQATYGTSGEAIDIRQSKSETEEHYTVLIPIDRGEHLGWVRVTSSLAELSQIRNHIWIDTLIATLITFFFTGTVLALVLHRSGKQLEDASKFAADLILQRGATIDSGSRVREIGQLKTALNQVSHALSEQYQALQDSEARKSAVLETSLDCLITIDQDGRIVDFNPAAESTFGYGRGEVIGQAMGELIVPESHRAAHEHGMRRYLATGHGPALHKRFEIMALRKNGQEFPVEISIVPFEVGGQRFFLGSLRDISERKAMEAEQQRIANVLQETLGELSAQKSALDEHAIVSIADLDGNIVYANEKFQQLSEYSSDELLGRNHRLLKSGLHTRDFYDDMWATISSGKVWHGEIANRRKDGEVYWVASTIVPMLDDNGLPRQYISIRTDITHQKRTEQQLDLYRQHLENLIEQYREAERDLAMARARELAIGNQIQRSLLFGDVPNHSGLTIAAHTEPSKGVDGDFYEFFRYGPDHFDLAIGDVMGKGIPAALVGAGVKQKMNQVMAEQLANAAQSGHRPDPADLINALHTKITPRLIALDTFVTLAYLRVDLPRHRISFVDAGHTSAILINTEGMRLLSGENLPLGVMEDEVYRQQELAMAPGDLIFLYSDGFTEARGKDGDEYGVHRLSELVLELHRNGVPPSILVQAVRKDVRDFEGHAAIGDDRTCIALQRDIAAPNPAKCLDLPWRLDGLPPLRGEIETMAREAGMAEEARDALILAAFEAATNVIRHGECLVPDATLHACLQDTGRNLELSFHYLGIPYVPEEMEPDFSGGSEGGFGLFIIRNSVDEAVYDSPFPGICRTRLSKRKDAGRPAHA